MPVGGCPSNSAFWKALQHPGLAPNEFPDGQWVKVVEWSGITLQTLVHKVTVTPETALVKWRRTGPLPTTVTQGTFYGEIDFNVYPKDTYLKIELWVDDPSVVVDVAFLGALSWAPPAP